MFAAEQKHQIATKRRKVKKVIAEIRQETQMGTEETAQWGHSKG